MTYKEYEQAMDAALAEADWRNPRDKNGPAYRVLARAAADKDLTLDEWQALHDRFYRRTETI